MKNLLPLTVLLALNLLTNTAPTFAGSEGGGGGDASEARVNEIRSDILSWINNGGAAGLKLSIPQTHYEEEMKNILQNKEVALSFTEGKVEVENKEKTCRGYFAENKPQMLCNITRFEKTSPSDQYRLIHHEYAGLALVEKNEGSASDYEISNQITDFLKEEKVLKLAIKKYAADSFHILSTRPTTINCQSIDKSLQIKFKVKKIKGEFDKFELSEGNLDYNELKMMNLKYLRDEENYRFKFEYTTLKEQRYPLPGFKNGLVKLKEIVSGELIIPNNSKPEIFKQEPQLAIHINITGKEKFIGPFDIITQRAQHNFRYTMSCSFVEQSK